MSPDVVGNKSLIQKKLRTFLKRR